MFGRHSFLLRAPSLLPGFWRTRGGCLLSVRRGTARLRNAQDLGGPDFPWMDKSFLRKGSGSSRLSEGRAEPTWGSAALRVIRRIGFEHGDQDGEQAIADATEGSGVGVTGSAGTGIAGLPVRVALHGTGPTEGASSSWFVG